MFAESAIAYALWFKNLNAGEPFTSILINCVLPHGAQSAAKHNLAVALLATEQLLLHISVIYLGLIPLDFTDSL